jgi:hypothetical protein
METIHAGQVPFWEDCGGRHASLFPESAEREMQIHAKSNIRMLRVNSFEPKTSKKMGI